MDASLIRKELTERRVVYDGSSEIGIESALVLPDYLGDIEKILKCSLSARASSKRIEGQRLSVGGMAFMRMLYITADGKVESFETQIPFSKNIDLSFTGENPTVFVRFETEYSNCLAVSPRRIELRGALLMRARVQVSAALSIAVDIADSGVETKKKCIEAEMPVCCISENFTVMEEYELPAPISSVVRMNANPKILEHKIVSGRLIIKGEIELNIVYMSDEADSVKSANFILPVNHFMTVNGAEEGDRAELWLEICRLSAEPIGKEANEIAVEVLLEAAAEICRRETIDAVVDCYCIGHESACEKAEISVTTLNKTEERTHQVCLAPDGAIGEAIDVFAEVKNISSSSNDHGEIMVKCDLTAGMLLRDDEGEVKSTEKTVPVEISLAADRDYIGAYCEPDVSILSQNRAGNKNEVCVVLLIKGKILKNESVSVINQMAISTEQSPARDPKTAMTIYFAKAGEDAFDIAKRYNTSWKAVLEENDLDEAVIKENRKILIPMVK